MNPDHQDTSPPLSRLKKIQNYFLSSRQSLAVAESCTGGLLGFWLSHLPGSSQYFKGGIISYQTELKIKLLGLCENQIQEKGLVTEDCALSMAQGVKKLLKSDWALSTTGIAGPALGELGEPVGKLAFGLNGPDRNKSQIEHFPGPKRQDIRHQAALFALDFLISEFK